MRDSNLRRLPPIVLALALVPTASANPTNEECLVQLSTTLVITIHENGTWPVTTEWVDYKCVVESDDFSAQQAASAETTPGGR